MNSEINQKQYNLLKALKENQFEDEFSNNRIFTAIFRGHETGWWCSHITKNALQMYINCDFSETNVVRSHVTARIETMRDLFLMPELPKADVLHTFMKERNRCRIATRNENSTNVFSDEIELPNGLFPSSNVGFKYRIGIEGKALRDLAEKNNMKKNI